MKIKLIVVGNVKETYYRNQIENLKNMINKRHEFTICELKDESIPKNASEAEEMKVREVEGARILDQITNGDYVYALCIDGTMLQSKQLKEHVQNQSEKTNGSLVFVIGGSIGLSNAVVARANYKLSFSKMTFPHQLMRVMLLEQISQF